MVTGILSPFPDCLREAGETIRPQTRLPWQSHYRTHEVTFIYLMSIFFIVYSSIELTIASACFWIPSIKDGHG